LSIQIRARSEGDDPEATNGSIQRCRQQRSDLEMKIKKYRRMADIDVSDELTKQRIAALVAELEQKLRQIDD
jgi:hypothetical protein